MSVGSDVLDNEHKILFDLANDLNNALNAGASSRVINTLFSVISDYAIRHFATEERYLQDDDNLLAHRIQHYDLIKKLHLYTLDYRNNRIKGAEPGEFLESWLLDHIKGSDLPDIQESGLEIDLGEEVDELDEFDLIDVDRRKHKRIKYDMLMDEEIIGNCYNAHTLKTTTITVIDLAPGGLKIHSEIRFNIDDLLIISCRIGKNFQLREKVAVRNNVDNFYGVEFISPEKKTMRFLTELSGAVHHFY